MVDFNTKDIIEASDTSKRLVQDEEYYRYIFKKTEKVVSVVFYILHNVPENSKTQKHIADIEENARHVHDAALRSLETRMFAAEDSVRQVALSLIALESKLRIAHTVGVMTPDIMHVLAAEIDTILRGLNRYLKPVNAFGEESDSAVALQFGESEPRRRKSAPRKERTESAPQPESGLDRRERIRTVLEAKGKASIKDIAEIITDVSEKTIQRELNAMIKDNVVHREGERRWSTYSIVS